MMAPLPTPNNHHDLSDETQGLTDHLLLINNVASAINASLDLSEVLDTACRAARAV